MKRPTEKQKTAVAMAVAAAGALLIIAGVLRGEARTVLEKAIRICTDCMGLGGREKDGEKN